GKLLRWARGIERRGAWVPAGTYSQAIAYRILRGSGGTRMWRSITLCTAYAIAVAMLPAASHSQGAIQTYTANVLQGEPDNVDPNRSSFAPEAAIVRQVFEPLLRFDKDLRPVAAAADSYDVSPDGTLYTFHLRPDGKFSDGVPVTALNFEYSFKRILDSKT